ncbi:MAG: permease [Akkermansiaceae bacterium]|nr:permease [Akkermansiaceae bacterium]
MADCCSHNSKHDHQEPSEDESCCGGGGGRFDWLLWGSLSVFLVGAGIHWWWDGAPEALHRFGHGCWTLAAKAWWGLALGILAMAVLSRMPRELVGAILGRGGSVSGLFRAVGAGVLLDLCNHGILMVGMGLYKRGVSLGQTMAFLIASPWNSLSLTLILAALIGWKWVGLFILLSMVIALVTGWIVDRLVGAGKLPSNPNETDLPEGYRIRTALKDLLVSLKPSFSNYRKLVVAGFSESTMILRWIFFGFVLTAAIQAFVPDDLFKAWFGPTVAGLFLTLIATTLLEVCSEGSSPIAADLLSRANAPGNAFVFLMAGAATDYTEIMALKETTKSWKATFALPLITVPQVLLIGWLIQVS